MYVEYSSLTNYIVKTFLTALIPSEVYTSENYIRYLEEMQRETRLDLVQYLVGDVNISLAESFDNDDIEAEVNIMIAEVIARRKGLSTLIVRYLIGSLKEIGVGRRMLATINDDNVESINLFKKLGFLERKTMACFKQI